MDWLTSCSQHAVEAGSGPCSEAPEEVESAANNIAMVLELGAISDSAWGNIKRYIDVRLKSACAPPDIHADFQRLLKVKKVMWMLTCT